jgi:hypothetical protein
VNPSLLPLARSTYLCRTPDRDREIGSFTDVPHVPTDYDRCQVSRVRWLGGLTWHKRTVQVSGSVARGHTV